MSERARHAVSAVAGLVLFAIALEVLRHELRSVTWSALQADLLRVPRSHVAIALLWTLASYAVLVGYDALAFRIVGKPLPLRRIALSAFLSYAISNNVGFAMISGASMRYRFYTRWGVSAEELSAIVFTYSVTFWLGLFALGGASLMVVPVPAMPGLPDPRIAPVAGLVLLVLPLLYIATTLTGRGPIAIGRWRLPRPTTSLALGQFGVSVADWSLAGAVLFALLPAHALPFATFLGPFLLAMLLGLASHVPGGAGVFEGVLVVLLRPFVNSADLLPCLVIYRVLYYLLPLAAALALLVADEWRLRRAHTERIAAAVGRVATWITPHLLGALAFIAGLILLFSGATPAAAGRLDWLHRFLPLGVIEASHFTGSVVGALLLILSQGLMRRLDAAYYFTSVLLAIGIGASLLKGLDYEEAILLALILAAVARARPAFDRRAAFFATRFSPVWVMSVVGAIGASAWLARFAFKHVADTEGLWWQFALHGQASRALRAEVGAAMVVLLFGVARLIQRPPPEFIAPDDRDLDDAARIIAGQPDTTANLVFLRDKTLLFNDARTGFIMYRVQGRSWVAMGDPVGPPAAIPDLVRTFLEQCDDDDGVPVFYEVSKTHLHCYADFGLTFVKIGEEARVDLRRVTFEGPAGAKYRKLIRRLEKDGGMFSVIAPGEVRSVQSELRAVSDDWLASRAQAEKGFSLGFFDPDYVTRFPAAIVRRGGRVVAFALLWPGANRHELSVDLMRFSAAAPKSTMEALFANLFFWGQAQGFEWFTLGMAPLAGVEPAPAVSIWNRLGSFVYQHGGSMYNFQGLRAFKAKFDPEWEPRYLVYPGGMSLPRLLADLAALVAGGYRRIFRR